jgi:hypothetical protein
MGWGGGAATNPDELFLFYAEGARDTISGFVYDYKLLYTTKEKGGIGASHKRYKHPSIS